MRRWSFNILAALSAVMCLAAAALWARSFWGWDSISALSGSHQLCLQTTRAGSIDIAVSLRGGTRGVYYVAARTRGTPGENGFDHVRLSLLGLGFGWPAPGVHDFWWVRMPMWLMMVLSMVLPAWWVRKRRHRRKKSMIGCCRKCGYDLRASEARCPECGTVFAAMR